MKHFIIYPAILPFIFTVYAEKFCNPLDNSSNILKEKSHQHCIPIDKEAVKKTITQKIDYLFDIDNQFFVNQAQIRTLKTIIVTEIYSKIDTTCYISSLEASQDLDNYVKDKLVQYIKYIAYDKALFEAQEWQSRSNYAKTKTNVYIFASKIAKQIAFEVKNRYIENNHGSLQDYWGNNLKDKIQEIASQEYRQ